MSNFKLLFSDYFEINESDLAEYGALNICLSSDLPLFIDPFLLFASEKKEYKKLHKQVVNHLLLLKTYATETNGKDLDLHLFRFPEIKQNWLGLSQYGNDGKGLGKRFANHAISAFNGFYSSFGNETISSETHIEKLTLLGRGVGIDFISDFTTNLIFEYLLKYTESFALKYIRNDRIKEFSVRCKFDPVTKTRQPKRFKLPYFFRESDGDFILLTPLDILTVNHSFINNNDFFKSFNTITQSIGNQSLRDAINNHFRQPLKITISLSIN